MAESAVAASTLTTVNAMSSLARPLRRICHRAAVISLGGIIVACGMMPERHRTSSATKAPITNAQRVKATSVERAGILLLLCAAAASLATASDQDMLITASAS